MHLAGPIHAAYFPGKVPPLPSASPRFTSGKGSVVPGRITACIRKIAAVAVAAVWASRRRCCRGGSGRWEAAVTPAVGPVSVADW
eukprot:9476209-Pyramimonas_sp.AAC.1